MKFSIIIPTYNEENDIRATIEALFELDYPEKEILIVDDSTDSTPKIVLEYKNRGVTLIHPGGGGRCEARNLGIQKATGEIVCILNADVRLRKDFLTRVKTHYDSGADYVLVSSRVSNVSDLFARYVSCISDYEYALTDSSWIQWTEGFTCRKTTAIQAGLFPTGFSMPICAGEDGYFGDGLKRIGAKRVLDTSIVVDHIAPSSFLEYWKIRKGRGSGLPQVKRFLEHYSLPRLMIRNGIKTSYDFLKCVTLLPGFLYCWKLCRFSNRKHKDLFPFFYAWLIEKLSFHAGMWKTTFELMKLRKHVKGE